QSSSDDTALLNASPPSPQSAAFFSCRHLLSLLMLTTSQSAEHLSMVNPDLICPECNQYAFVVSTGIDDTEKLTGAICHCCGHVIDKNEIVRRLKEAAAANTLRR